MAFRWTVASSSVWPPDKKQMPANRRRLRIIARELVENRPREWARTKNRRKFYEPGTAGGTVLCRAVTVALAISSGVALTGHDWPGVTMFGFNNVPSRYTWWSLSALYTAANTVSVTFWHLSISWSPSGTICFAKKTKTNHLWRYFSSFVYEWHFFFYRRRREFIRR